MPGSDPKVDFDADCGIPGPAIDIEKSTNDEDADRGSGPRMPAGTAVTWTYDVTNTGNVALIDIVVTDSREGDICVAAMLAIGESMKCTLEGTAITGRYRNLGTVTANAGGVEVTASDASGYVGTGQEEDEAEAEAEAEEQEENGAKVQLCHLTGTDRYQLIEVSVDAMDDHLAHGDGRPGVDPFDATCAVSP